MKRSKKNEQGLASIVIVGVLVILLALITLGFSKIMNRAVNNSLNSQLAAAANYAAQSGINDVMAYIKGQASPDDVSSSDCTTLLKEPGLSNLVDLSGDGNTKITCLLVNPKPTDLMYQQLAPNGSQIIKATASDAIDQVMVSWQASNGTNNTLPSSLSFSDVPTWNNAGNVPVVRIGLYPVPPNGKISGIQANSKTFFLAPGNGSGTVTTIPYSTTDGTVTQVACNAKNTGISGFTADYTCNAIINGLYTNIAPDSYYYLTITPIYNQADVKIKALNTQKQSVQFVDVQTVIDATAKANTAKKRLQERVDSNTTGDNIAATEYAAPDYAIRSEKALCKQIELHQSYYNYILNDAPNTCNSGASGIPTVAPTLTLTITGNDGNDSGTTRDSGDATPPSSGYNGVVYVNSSASVNWKSTDSALSCLATSQPAATDSNGHPWNEDKNPRSSWSGVTGTGSAQFNGISYYTTYSMQCKGPGGTTPTKTVTAWPKPIVSFAGSTTSFNAGNSYLVKWTAWNADHCTMSSTGNNSWDQSYSGLNPRGAGDQQWFGTDWRDKSTKHYTIQCWDPIGRSTSLQWTVGPNSSGPDNQENGPSCSATAQFAYTNNKIAGAIVWNASCPEVDPAGGGSNYYIDTNVPGIPSGYVDYNGANGSMNITTPGNYYFQIYTWAPTWNSPSDASGYGGTSGSGVANSGRQTIAIHPKISISFNSDGIWDQGPSACKYTVQNTPPFSPSNPQYGYHSAWPDGTWWCRNGRFPDPNGSHTPYSTPGCPDGVHRWTSCNVYVDASASGGGIDDTGSISCTMYSWYGQFASGGAFTSSGRVGWSGSGNPNWFHVDCSDGYDSETDWENFP